MSDKLLLQKWYTRIIAAFFILVILSLITDLTKFGFRPETMHKFFHVILGVIVAYWGWNNREWWRILPLVNGVFFTFVALFGWLFPDFGGLDAFNRIDTILHTIVGVSGSIIGIAFFPRKVTPLVPPATTCG